MKRVGVMMLAGAMAGAMALTGCSGGSSSDNGASSTPVASNGSGSDAAGTSAANLTIAVIPKGATHDYWKCLHEGVNKAQQELGCKIIWDSPLKENDRDQEISIVEDAIQKKVNGIVLAPLDANALKTPVQNAENAKIPVVIIDSGINGVPVSSFVATDNEKGGHMAGAELARLLGGKGKIVVLKYAVNSASTEEREKGFLDEIAKNKDIQVVDSSQYGAPTQDTAQSAAENLLSRYKNPDGSLSIQGIFTSNESNAMGVLRVLVDSQWAGKVKFVGFDANAKLIDGLKAHQIDALVVQDPRKMGYEGVKTMVDVLQGKKVDARIDTGATLVTPANVNDPTIAALIAPPAG